jgi:hypothetical protein
MRDESFAQRCDAMHMMKYEVAARLMKYSNLVHAAVEPEDLVRDSFECRLRSSGWCIIEYAICQPCRIASSETPRTGSRGLESSLDAASPATCASETAQRNEQRYAQCGWNEIHALSI